MQIPDILDNIKEPRIGEVVNYCLGQSDNAAIAVGYFRVSGWQHIYTAIDDNKVVRILTDSEMDRETASAIHAGLKLRDDIGELKDSDKKWVLHLRDAMRNGHVQIRQLKKDGKLKRLHAKAYMMDNIRGENPITIIGSSNLTHSGLVDNTELNAVRKEGANYEIALKWFDDLWKEAVDIEPTIRAEIEKSQFGEWYSPFEIYVRALISYVGDEVFAEQGYKDYEALAQFQRDAVDRAWKILKVYHGVMIADGVGLGKTFIGKGLIQRYLSDYQNGIKPVLVLCPAALRRMWEDETYDFDSVKVESMEGLGRFNPDDEDYRKLIERKRKEWRKYQVIIIDEAHSFRNEKSNRYQALNEITDPLQTEKQIEWIFLTATPINNRISDISALLNLVTRGDQKYFAPDVPNINSLIQRVSADIDERLTEAKKNNDYSLLPKLRAQAADSMDKLFNLFVIRRSRSYIIKHYEGAKIKGKEVKFPKRKTKRVQYSLEETYKGRKLFEKISSHFADLSLNSYRPELIKQQAKQDSWELGRQNAVVGLIMLLLLKRLESSVEAFKISITKLLESQKAILNILEKEKVLISKKGIEMIASGLVEDYGSLDADFYLDLDKENLDETKCRDLIGSIYDDISNLKAIQEMTDRISPNSDDKLQALKRYLTETPGKILIFSEFEDTIVYLRNNLREDPCLGVRELDWITGSHDSAEKQKKIEAFSPISNSADPDKEVDILLCTDVLAEGLNLQDAGGMVNYDLTWNPVRVIQRIGRIDRLGSSHDEVQVAWFGAEDGLDKLLGLIERFKKKGISIAETIGIEGEIPTLDNLMEFFDDRNFNETGDVTFRESMIGELNRIYSENKDLVEHLTDAPYRIRGAKTGNSQEQVFIYELRFERSERKMRSPFFLIWADNTLSEDVKRAFGIMKCTVEEEKIEPQTEIDWSKGEAESIDFLKRRSLETKKVLYDAQRLTGKLKQIKDILELQKEHDLVSVLESVTDKSLKNKILALYNSADKPIEKDSGFFGELRELMAGVQMSRGEKITAQIKGKVQPIMVCREVITENYEEGK